MSTAGAWKRFHAWLGSHFDELKAEDIDRMTKVAAGELVGLPENITVAPCWKDTRVVQVVFRDDHDYVVAVQSANLRPDETPTITWLKSDGSPLCPGAEAIVGVQSCPGLNDWAFCSLEDNTWVLRFVETVEDEFLLGAAPQQSAFVVWQENDQVFAAVPTLAGPRGSVCLIPVTEPKVPQVLTDPTTFRDIQIVQVVDGKPLIMAIEPDGTILRGQWGMKPFKIFGNQSIVENGLWIDDEGRLNFIGREERSGEMPGVFLAREDWVAKVAWLPSISLVNSVCGHGRILRATMKENVWTIKDILSEEEVVIKNPNRQDHRLHSIHVVPDGFLAVFQIDNSPTWEFAVVFVDRNLQAEERCIYYLQDVGGGPHVRRSEDGGLLVVRRDHKRFWYLKPNRQTAGPDIPLFTMNEHRLYGGPQTIQAVDGGLRSWQWVDGTLYLITYT